MNRLERGFPPPREAKIKFFQGDFKIVLPGTFVRCAVTGEPIAIDDLKYWNVERQEAYASAAVAFARHLELIGQD